MKPTNRTGAGIAIVLSLWGASAALAAVGIGEKIPEFTTRLLEPPAFDTPVELRTRAQPHPTVYFMLGTTCGTTNAYIDRVSELARTYSPRGVEFVFVYPNGNDTLDAKKDFHRKHGLEGGLVDDRGAALAFKIGAQRTAEVFLVDKEGTLLYHGAVDDSNDASAVRRRHLALALDEHLAGKPISLTTSTVSA